MYNDSTFLEERSNSFDTLYTVCLSLYSVHTQLCEPFCRDGLYVDSRFLFIFIAIICSDATIYRIRFQSLNLLKFTSPPPPHASHNYKNTVFREKKSLCYLIIS